MACNKCEHCGNRYHWSHTFSKFGYDDGDGKIKTTEIAELRHMKCVSGAD